MKPPPIISVIIPNLNSTVIDQTLTALLGQKVDPSQIEILVIGLDRPGLVKSRDPIRFIDTKGPKSPAIARNIGILEAQGDILCFTDADGIPNPNWLFQLTTALLNPEISIVGGGITFAQDHYWTLSDNLGWFHDFLETSLPGKRLLLPSLNLCVRREVIDKVGLFDEIYLKAAGEDAEWTTRMRRAGYSLYFKPEATVYHEPNRSSLQSIWQHGINYGRYSIKIRPDYISFLQTPLFLRNWWLVLLLAPVMALYITFRIYWDNPSVRLYWQAFPGIFLGKLAWCLGVSQSLRQPINMV